MHGTIDKVELVGNKFCAQKMTKCMKILIVLLTVSLAVGGALVALGPGPRGPHGPRGPRGPHGRPGKRGPHGPRPEHPPRGPHAMGVKGDMPPPPAGAQNEVPEGRTLQAAVEVEVKAETEAKKDDDKKPRGPKGHHGKKRHGRNCLLYTSQSPRDQRGSRMPSSA